RQAGRHRARRRHLAARPDAAVGRIVRHLARAEPRLSRRPRDAASRHGDLRRALRVVPQPDRRDPQLAAQDGAGMSAQALLILSRADIARLMTYGDYVEAIEAALRAAVEGWAVAPPAS